MGKHGMAYLLNLFFTSRSGLCHKSLLKRFRRFYGRLIASMSMCTAIDRYYPTIGDDAYFCMPRERYCNSGGVENLVIWKLYEITKDKNLVKVLVRD